MIEKVLSLNFRWC